MTIEIKELTPEMKERIPLVRDEWIKIGLDTSPASKEQAEKGVREAYEIASLTPPKVIEWVSSPMQGCKLAAQWEKSGKALPFGHVELPEVTKEEIINQLQTCCYGQHDASWLAFYEFFAPYLPEIIKKLDGHFNVARAAHWWWPKTDGCIICDRPTTIKLDDTGRLHCEDGPAVEYRDGYKQYKWHGVSMPKWIYEQPEKFTAESCLKESNQEIRRAMIEKLGLAEFLEALGAEVIQEDERGQLVTFAGIDGGERKERFVLVKDTSTDRKYALCVPPDTETAAQGVARTFGFDKAEDYNPISES